MIEYKQWEDVGNDLKSFKYKKRYVNPERYIADNPLQNLIVPPDIERFFGTKVINIFIIGVPYMWEMDEDGVWQDNWPPEDLEDTIQRHKDMYNQFTWYETHIYMDFNIVQKIMEANSNSRFEEMMTAVRGHLEEVCDELADFGFTLEDDITDAVGADFFQPVIDTFISNTANVI